MVKKRIRVFGSVAGIAASAIVLATLVPASSQQAATTTKRVCEVNNTGFSKFIDVGKHGFSAGDYQLSSTPVYDTATGKRVATDVVKITIVNRIGKRNARFILDATLVFKAGRVTAYGPGLFSNFRKGINFAVTGGTGAYRLADGTAFAKNGLCRGKPGVHITLNLTLQ